MSKEKREFLILDTREIAMAAAFGGILFAQCALGLLIPVAPGYAMWPLYTFLPLAAIVGGPIVAWVALFVGSLTRNLLVNPAYMAAQVFLAFTYWPMRNTPLKYRIPGFIILMWISEYVIQTPIAVWIMQNVLFFVAPGPDAYWSFLLFMFGTHTLSNALIPSIVVPLLMKVAPEFMKPTWFDRWRGKI